MTSQGDFKHDFASITTDEQTINELSARIFNSQDQSVANTTTTTVTLDEQDSYNPGDVLTIDTANNKITIEKSGIYVLLGGCTFDSPGDGTRMQLRVNVGASFEDTADQTAGGNDHIGPRVNAIVQITSPPADVTMDVFQNSGGSINTDGGESRVHLDVARLG